MNSISETRQIARLRAEINRLRGGLPMDVDTVLLDAVHALSLLLAERNLKELERISREPAYIASRWYTG